MFEIIGVIIYGLFAGACWLVPKLLKASFYFLKYTLPIWFVVAGFFIGGSWGDGKFGSMTDDYIEEQAGKYTHKVTIHWNNANADEADDFDVYYIREDLNWTINGNTGWGYDVFEVENADGVSLPSQVKKEGWVFMGLYDTNGNKYITESGYSLITVKDDIVLFARYKEAPVQPEPGNENEGDGGSEEI